MFAVLKTGGKQYTVRAGDVLRVELIAAGSGDKVQFNDVLMVGGDKPVVGSPLVKGAAVQAEVIEGQIKAEKVITYHKRRRKHSSQRTRGHRQKLTLVRITDILASGAEKSGVAAAIGTHAARVAAHGTEKAAVKPAKAAKAEAGPAAVAEAAPARPKRAAKTKE
jgi:large subunit ribosomal protein L21